MSRLTKNEGDALAADLGEQDRLRDKISEAEAAMRVLGMQDYAADKSNEARNFIRSTTLPDADKRTINHIVTRAFEAWDKLNDLEIARTKRRTDFLGNEYTVGDFVTWPIGSGSSSAISRIGRVVEFRNNGAVAIMPMSGRWGHDDPKLVTVKATVGYVVCITKIINTVQEDTP